MNIFSLTDNSLGLRKTRPTGTINCVRYKLPSVNDSLKFVSNYTALHYTTLIKRYLKILLRNSLTKVTYNEKFHQ